MAALAGALACRAPDHARTTDSLPLLRHPSLLSDPAKLRDATSTGRFTHPAMLEASGLVRATREPGVFWSHNDSGNDERLFAFDSAGRALAVARVNGARNRDWEALSLGPCARVSCVYLGDVGDNSARRRDVTLWRFPEPTTQDTVIASAQRVVFRYADGPRDVEAIWVTPDTSVFLLTKRPDKDRSGHFRPARIYRIPASAWHTDAVVTAEIVDSLPIVPTPDASPGWITDAAVSVAEHRLAVRTYRDVFVFGVDSLTWRPTALVARCSLRTLREGYQGEGVTWLADGRLLFVAEGKRAQLHTGRCP
ncbi:MAG: hypothetical protein ABMA00_02145 [Gemmatimonas sp.]